MASSENDLGANWQNQKTMLKFGRWLQPGSSLIFVLLPIHMRFPISTSVA